ncbi:Txe/YoeB family addiction module toxin [Pelobium manganitolerans]|uniref:Txe/YoeB family addiction module toxin n=1 Tax=Pelobium manganitolerans TaxID=1842495 RepID=UPI003FA3DBB4
MRFNLSFSPQASRDIKRIKNSGDKALMKKLVSLLNEIAEHPTTGTGKPEQLKHYRMPTWSRRISKEHRLVYSIENDIVTVLILSAYGHYK